MSREAVVSLTRSLVEIPSHEDETAAGDFIADWVRTETDAAVTRDDAGNVIARRSADDETDAVGNASDADSLALVGHHDVVPPADEQTDDDGSYRIEQRDGRLHGRGTADMKGALAAAMLAFRDADPTVAPATDLVFASFVGEEQGGIGAQAAIDDGFAPDRAVVVEGSTGYSAPGVTDVAVAHKGRRGSTLLASGTAGHASRPDDAENAVYRACDAVDIVRSLDAPETTVLGNDLSGSVAVTEIDGGSAWNVIPESCSVTIDERTVPGERVPLGETESIAGVEWRVDQDLPPMACGDAAFADRVLAAADAAQADAPEHVVKPHATDAGWLAAAGTDCVVVGAAEPGEAHTATESVSIDVLERCYEIYRRVADADHGE
ncbi:M20 family peptidase [Halonotius terrestris]|uniref:M20 family peptidase n=1 Tax=Halonotius terrestris TaxID=2487750 RepID=A0A8J8TDX4_9EURY|nr:M20/M25/M40 family metallo-hydrolase [Halonotius terrestris]TQQ83742.1 M20 family peptidase [Halonotius terrestris]